MKVNRVVITNVFPVISWASTRSKTTLISFVLCMKKNSLNSINKAFTCYFSPCLKATSALTQLHSGAGISWWLEILSNDSRYTNDAVTHFIVLNISFEFIWIWISPSQPVSLCKHTSWTSRRKIIFLKILGNSEWKLLIIGINKMKFLFRYTWKCGSKLNFMINFP